MKMKAGADVGRGEKSLLIGDPGSEQRLQREKKKTKIAKIILYIDWMSKRRTEQKTRQEPFGHSIVARVL